MGIAHKYLVGAAAAAYVLAASASAQTDRSGFEVGVQVPSANSGEFDTTDVGVGARIGWRAGWLGVEAEFDGYPRDFPAPAPFSGGRIEGCSAQPSGRGSDACGRSRGCVRGS